MSISEEPGTKKMVYIGIAGSILAALCCFTPVLVLLLGAVGLSTWLGWLDYGLLPAMVVFPVVAAWAVWRRRRMAAGCRTPIENKEGT